jgi:hypothetical protein
VAEQSHDPDRQALIGALASGQVEFIVIGGAAVESHGIDYRTVDIDLAPQASHENLARLADVLNELRPSLVISEADDSQDVPLPAHYFTADSLKNQTFWNLRTSLGKLDIAFAPAGFPNGYDDLQAHAQPRQLAATTLTVQVASLEDVEHSKRVAGRPKDTQYLQRVGRLEPPSMSDALRLHNVRNPPVATTQPAHDSSRPGPPPTPAPGRRSDLER